jgi:RHS repeat-associated protein
VSVPYTYGALTCMYDGTSQNVFLHYKFTGKERDGESNLDDFGARFNSSTMGRFMSPDPESAGADSDDPQSWNAYSYGLNNPVNVTDPDGRDPDPCKDDPDHCVVVHADQPPGIYLT